MLIIMRDAIKLACSVSRKIVANPIFLFIFKYLVHKMGLVFMYKFDHICHFGSTVVTPVVKMMYTVHTYICINKLIEFNFSVHF